MNQQHQEPTESGTAGIGMFEDLETERQRTAIVTLPFYRPHALGGAGGFLFAFLSLD